MVLVPLQIKRYVKKDEGFCNDRFIAFLEINGYFSWVVCSLSLLEVFDYPLENKRNSNYETKILA